MVCLLPQQALILYLCRYYHYKTMCWHKRLYLATLDFNLLYFQPKNIGNTRGFVEIRGKVLRTSFQTRFVISLLQLCLTAIE